MQSRKTVAVSGRSILCGSLLNDRRAYSLNTSCIICCSCDDIVGKVKLWTEYKYDCTRHSHYIRTRINGKMKHPWQNNRQYVLKYAKHWDGAHVSDVSLLLTLCKLRRYYCRLTPACWTIITTPTTITKVHQWRRRRRNWNIAQMASYGERHVNLDCAN